MVWETAYCFDYDFLLGCFLDSSGAIGKYSMQDAFIYAADVSEGWLEMTREELIAYGKRRYGEKWVNKLAKAIGYSVSSIMRIESGETSEVSRRMELEIKELRRKQQFETLSRPDVRY